MKIYTKTGDHGSTSLVGGQRTGKDDPRVEAYGTVDELTAVIAYLRDSMDESDGETATLRGELRRIINTLMSVETLLATGENSPHKIDDIPQGEIDWLESRIDVMGSRLEPLTRFTIPGGHPLVSLAHVCRTVCRRAEREAVRASREHSIPDSVFAYLNRLSDYLYQLGRTLSAVLGAEELVWEPPAKE